MRTLPVACISLLRNARGGGLAARSGWVQSGLRCPCRCGCARLRHAGDHAVNLRVPRPGPGSGLCRVPGRVRRRCGAGHSVSGDATTMCYTFACPTLRLSRASFTRSCLPQPQATEVRSDRVEDAEEFEARVTVNCNWSVTSTHQQLEGRFDLRIKPRRIAIMTACRRLYVPSERRPVPASCSIVDRTGPFWRRSGGVAAFREQAQAIISC